MADKDPEKNRARARAWARANREKNAQRSAEWRKKNPDANREWIKAHPAKRKQDNKANNLRRYGITVADYDQMLVAQNGVCKICRQVCVTGRSLSVDHCHETGKVRGLLCASCNNGLGRFKDNALLLRAAAEYLERG